MTTEKSSTPAVTNKMLSQVDSSLSRASTCVKGFSQQLREAYFQNEALMTVDTIHYRAILYSECYMYASKVFPTTIKLFEDVKDMLESYTLLKFDDFETDIDELRDCCLKFSKQAKRVQLGHIFVLGNLKSVENQMQVKVSALISHEIECRDRATELKKRGDLLKNVGGVALAVSPALGFVDGGAMSAVGAIMAGAAIMGGQHHAAAAEKSESIANSASYNRSILKGLIGSLQEFSEAVNLVASFVSLMEVELRQLGRIGKGQQLRRSHYNKIKGKAENLVASCDRFLEIQPAIQSDLLSVGRKLVQGFAEEWERQSRAFHASSTVDISGSGRVVGRRGDL